MHVFVDEAGVPHDSDRSSDHLVVSGVAVRDRHLGKLAPALAELRGRLGHQPEQVATSWKNIKGHSRRLHAAQSIGEMKIVRTITIVICKRQLERNGMTAQERYQWTLRLLLERVSWLAEKHEETAHVVLSHIKGLEEKKLREYEAILERGRNSIRSAWLDPAGCEVVGYNDRVELQLADIVASATACAFEEDEFGNVEDRYLRALRNLAWDGRHVHDEGVGGDIRKYGLKFHPAKVLGLARYRWVREF